MDFKEEMEICLRARFTLIWVVSYEEERIIGMLRDICVEGDRRLVTWDWAARFRPIVNQAEGLPDARDPGLALDAIAKAAPDQEAVFALKDFHQCLQNQPVITRQLRNLAQDLRSTRKTVIILCPQSKVPDDLRDDVFVIDFPPPGVTELKEILDRFTGNPAVRVALTPLGREKLLQSGLGLSSNQAMRVFGKSIVAELRGEDGQIIKRAGILDETGIDMVTHEKKSIIRESGALEFHSPTETLGDVGGLGVLKAWLRERERAFTQEARDYGLPAPKGIALIGIPGTGKSLTAKMVASLWSLPLIRLDVGALFGGIVGQSEENTRRALRLVETIAPCLLWIDEMEKAFAYGGGDGGTSLRVFGDVLSWMQEKKKPVFVIGVANDISMLPPEFLRKGRFDEVFFLDLPTQKEREEILAVHIEKRGRPPASFQIRRLAEACRGYVGAEIEQAVTDGMVMAFNDAEREFTTDDILKAFGRQIPLSKSQAKAIELLRGWLREGRAQSASYQEAEEAERNFVNLDIE